MAACGSWPHVLLMKLLHVSNGFVATVLPQVADRRFCSQQHSSRPADPASRLSTDAAAEPAQLYLQVWRGRRLAFAADSADVVHCCCWLCVQTLLAQQRRPRRPTSTACAPIHGPRAPFNAHRASDCERATATNFQSQGCLCNASEPYLYCNAQLAKEAAATVETKLRNNVLSFDPGAAPGGCCYLLEKHLPAAQMLHIG